MDEIDHELSIAFETNGRGYLGFICELPGAFVRGQTLEEALAKVEREVKRYQKWLGNEKEFANKAEIVQLH